MRPLQLAAVWALHARRRPQRIVRTALISSGLGNLSFRYSHLFNVLRLGGGHRRNLIRQPHSGAGLPLFQLLEGTLGRLAILVRLPRTLRRPGRARVGIDLHGQVLRHHFA